MYDYNNNEFRLIYSAERTYIEEHVEFKTTIWSESGNTFFIDYYYSFCYPGNKDSAEYYDIDCSGNNAGTVYYLLKYDLLKDELTTLCASKYEDFHMQAGSMATDTSVLCETKGGYAFLNVQNMEFTEIWNENNKTTQGDIRKQTISPNGKFIAYYTDNSFVLEDVSGNDPELLYTHPIDFKAFGTNIDFTPDSRRVCYGIESTSKDSDPYGRSHDYGKLKFGWGEIVKVE